MSRSNPLDQLKPIHDWAHGLKTRDPRLYVVVNVLVDALEYMMNSYSLHEGKLYYFDLMRLKEYLAQIMSMEASD